MSFTIDGTSASTLNVKLKSDYQEPGSPGIRDRELTVPGRSGKHDFGSEYDVRTFELPLVTLNTSSQSEVQEVIREFADALTDQNGKPKTVDLSFTKESDKHYEVKLDQEMGIRRYPGNLADFTVRLRAVEPFALSDTSSTSATITGSPETFETYNSGSAETPIKLTLTNSGANTISGFTLNVQE